MNEIFCRTLLQRSNANNLNKYCFTIWMEWISPAGKRVIQHILIIAVVSGTFHCIINYTITSNYITLQDKNTGILLIKFTMSKNLHFEGKVSSIKVQITH